MRPLHSTGRFSSAVAAESPHTPPIAIPAKESRVSVLSEFGRRGPVSRRFLARARHVHARTITPIDRCTPRSGRETNNLPNSERMPRNWRNVWVKPVPICKMAQMIRLAVSGHLRPYRSERMPKMMAPTGRKRSARVILVVCRVHVHSRDEIDMRVR